MFLKHKLAEVQNLKAGDVIFWYGEPIEIERIDTLTNGFGYRLYFKLTDRMKGINSQNLTGRFFMDSCEFGRGSTVACPVIRKCNPCYDSDCPCIYDEVP